jgi:hypothetical protein
MGNPASNGEVVPLHAEVTYLAHDDNLGKPLAELFGTPAAPLHAGER